MHCSIKFLLIIFLIALTGCNNCSTNSSDRRQDTHDKTGEEIPEEKTDSNPLSGELFLQASQAIAADFSAAKKLQRQYKNLKVKVGVKTGHNLDPTFVGIEGLKKALRNRPGLGEGDLNKFKNWAQKADWKQFGPGYNHYDWWMFPIDRSSQGQGFGYTVYEDDIQELQTDLNWLKDYRLGAILLMQSWGWDVKNKKIYPKLAPGQAWRNWGVRLGKLAHSLILFEQWDLYDSLKDYVKYLVKSGVSLEAWILNYFSDQ